MNQTTRKHPRTLEEAFGPYTGRELYAPPDPRRARFNALAACFATLAALILVGVLLAWRG
jgi:hypothetical protein